MPLTLPVVLAWVDAHPVFATLILWPIISSLVTLLLKPRSPAEYTAMASRSPVWLWSRLTPMLQLVGALGLDPVKALAVLSKVVTGKQNGGPPKPPMPPALLILIALTFGIFASGCALFTKQNACRLINTADDVCTMISVPTPDGGTEQVPVKGSELRAFARGRAAARAFDAGAEGGAP